MLVAVDGSESARKATETAAKIAADAGAELAIMHVIELPSISTSGEVYVPFDKLEIGARREADRFMAELLKVIKNTGARPKVKIVISDGSVVDTIVRYAVEENVDLIVAGTRGLGGFKRLILGSVAAGLVHYSSCSVMIVR